MTRRWQVAGGAVLSRDLPTFLSQLVRRVCSQRPHTTHLGHIEPATICSTIVPSPPDTAEITSSRDDSPQTHDNVQVLAKGRPSRHPAPLCMSMWSSRGVM